MTNRPVTPSYIIFYILFSTETWRIVLGLILSFVATPGLLPPELTSAARALVYVMVATIGYSLAGRPARWISNALKKAILGNRHTDN